MEIKELLKLIGENKENQELITGLVALNLVKVEEKQAEYTDEGVLNYISKSQKISDKLYNDNAKKFLSKKLGKDLKDVKDEDLGMELVSKNSLTEQAEKYGAKLKDYEIAKALGDKAELLKPHIDLSKVTIDDNFNIKGLDEQVTGLKTKFASLFETKDPTPPVPGGTGFKGGSGNNINPWAKDTWDTQKQVELFKENKELAEQYMKETGYDY